MADKSLPAGDLELLNAAREVAGRAFNPVSRFAVGAAVRTSDGAVYRGTFLESSALPLGVCAESGALVAALTDGKRDFEAVAVVGGDPARPPAGQGPVTPCGGCRQRIFDVCSSGGRAHLRVLCANLDLSDVRTFTIEELLPAAFGAEALPAASWRLDPSG